MQYADYSVKDFVLDEYFQKWVFFNDPEVRLFWERWLNKHPEKESTIEEARQFLLSMEFEQSLSTEKDFQEVWEKIELANEKMTFVGNKPFADKESKAKMENNKKGIFVNFYRVAASVLLLLIAGAGIFISGLFDQKMTYATGYGETKTVILPDSTKVTMNANSQLSHAADFGEDNSEKLREVRLTGEAFFEVTPKNKSLNRGNFVVHSRQLNVEVLGTKFNVNTRHGKTQVVLNEGSVKINPESKFLAQPVFKDAIIMQPGDLVELGDHKNKLVKKKVNPQLYTAWRNNKLVFNQQTIGEIAKVLEDQYGFEVIIKDPSLANKVFTGTTPLDSVEILFQTMAKSFNIKIDKQNDKVIFKRK